jgi:preprotein translocase subunit SecE
VNSIRRFKQYMTEVWSELKKTTWPSRKDVYGTTLVVIVTVLICAFYLWLVDSILSRGMQKVFEVFG